MGKPGDLPDTFKDRSGDMVRGIPFSDGEPSARAGSGGSGVAYSGAFLHTIFQKPRIAFSLADFGTKWFLK